ncbi:MAG: ATP-dependent DNA helicase [Alphaproteobacteria bacterium]|nr:ATP-dependent DNA helicase [Alphaproteobacteria bacterium]
MESASFTSLDAIPALVATFRRAVIAHGDGRFEQPSVEQALAAASSVPHLTAHTRLTLQRLGQAKSEPRAMHFDVLELFAFVRPAQPIAPSVTALARALKLEHPASLPEQASVLRQAAEMLLEEAANLAGRPMAARVAAAMGLSRWAWAPLLLERMDPDGRAKASPRMDVWRDLPEWEDAPPLGQPGSMPISPEEARAHLSAIVGPGAETRRTQSDFAALAAQAFRPRAQEGEPSVVLAEAGTGLGKTAGYLAPATLWAERNDGTVWISSYTKNLQRQIAQELMRVYPDEAERAEKVTVRKGRENYVCLLNFEEASGRLPVLIERETVALGLVARWLTATKNGDLQGGDFPAWAWPHPGFANALTDRHGECIYAACPHYRRCFLERTVRKTRSSRVVVANHALTMVEAARNAALADSDPDERSVPPLRYVFDEGHHIFDAADSFFAIHITGWEGAELRRWLRGAEGRSARRGRGLVERLTPVFESEVEGVDLLQEVAQLALALPGDGWLTRVANEAPRGAMEKFLSAVRAQVRARSEDVSSPYGLECEVAPATPALAEAARELQAAFKALVKPLNDLSTMLRTLLREDGGEQIGQHRMRAEAALRGIERRAKLQLPNWVQALGAVGELPPGGNVDWLGVERFDGRDTDIGFYRHSIDPTVAFAAEVLEPSHGAFITSATLRDRPPEEEVAADGWRSAEIRTGAAHLVTPPVRAAFASPFDYGRQTRVLVVRDLNRDADLMAGAYRDLFLAAGGGALGLFTSIRSLRHTYRSIAGTLSAQGVPLYAQHVDGLDTGSLVDLFREDEDSCLLGTDALRDGVDVPGRSLRLVVFERVPWPRPDILHKARRAAFGKGYDDQLTRLRLAQGFGRLIRRASDRGVFVLLDARTPSRLLSGLPPGVEVQRVGIAEAIATVKDFLHAPGLADPRAHP